MKTMELTYVSVVLLLVAAKVNGVPQGRNVEEEKPQPGNENPFPDFGNGPLIFRRFRDDLPKLIKNLSSLDWEKAAGQGSQGPLGINSLYNTLLGGVHSLYQDLVNRQQAFINLLTCGNCINDGWNAIMEVAQTVPELEWVYKPSSEGPATFFTAVYQNGTVTGIGGSIVNDKPVAEYAFGKDGIVQNLPQKNKKNRIEETFV